MVGDSQISLIVLETYFSCDTFDRGLWLAILSLQLCPETDRNITGSPDVLLVKLIYKQQYVCEVTSKINCKEVKIFIK